MKGKKLIALLLAGTMILGSAVTVLADDVDVTVDPAKSNVTGEGQLEAFIDTDVFKVVLPTTTAEGLGFTMDPQGLLKVAEVEGATGAGDVLFMEAEDVAKSDDITIKNKSSFKVDVSVKSEVTATGVTLVDEETKLATATVPSLFLKMESNEETPEISEVLAADTTVSATLDEIEYKFDAKTVETEGYKKGSSGDRWYAYIPKEASDSNDVTFNISGKCDDAITTGTDWSGVTSASSIKLTYTVTKQAEAPDLTPTATAATSADGTKYWFAPSTPCTSIASVDVYDSTTSTKVGSVASDGYMVSASGNVQVVKTKLSAVASSAGTYAIVVTTDAGSDVFTVTVE